jgi:hypothetical protein
VRHTKTILLCLVLSTSTAALADRRELVVELEAGLAVQWLGDPSATRVATGLGPAGQLHVFYGLTNALHVGAYFRGFYAPDLAFPAITVTLDDGSTPAGTLYENLLGVGAGASVRWRFDTGYPFAPFLQLEGGVTWLHLTNLQLIPTDKSFGIALPSTERLAPDARLLAGLEYRLGERLLLSLQIGARRTFGPSGPWQLDGALAAGLVF